MSKEYDNLENEALRFGAGVPAGTKWRSLSKEQQQGFDNYMRTKIRRDPGAFANDTRANKYLRDYDQSTFDAMRQQELNDSVNPGDFWNDFGAGDGVESDFGNMDDLDQNEETRAREDERDNIRGDEEDKPKQDDSATEGAESPEEQPEETGEPSIGEDTSAKPKIQGEPNPTEGATKPTVPGLGDGAKTAGNVAKTAEASEAVGAVGGAAAGAAELEGAAAVTATAGAAGVEFLIVVIVLAVIFLVLIALWGIFAQNPGGNEDSSLTVPANILEYCTANYEKYDSQSELKQIYGSSESEVSAQIKSIDFPTTTGKITVHEKAAPCFEAVARELKSSGSTYKIVSGGTYNWRPNVNSPSNLSLHSFGIAMDINSGANCNRCGTPPNCTTDMPPDFVAIWKKYGFRWGGDYRSTCDAMHYEWMGGAPSVAIPSFDDSGNTIKSSTSSGGIVVQPSHQTDTSGGLEASRANIIADYALAALTTTSKKKVSSWPNQTGLSYWNTGSNACTGSTARGTGYFWEITESNKISPKVFVGIHLNGGTKGTSVQGFYHEGEAENKAFAADLAAAIDSATSLSAVSPGKDSLDRDCGSAGTRYKSSDGKNGFFSIDAGVNKAKYRVILEVGDNEKNQGFWTEANMKLVGEAIARVSSAYANK